MTKNFIDYFNNIVADFNKPFFMYDNDLGTNSGFPKYNIISGETDNLRILEIALAGYKKEDIKIEVIKNKIRVFCDKVQDENKESEIYRGIAKRTFESVWQAGPNNSIEVLSAEMVDGILTIKMNINVPEEFKPKSYTIK